MRLLNYILVLLFVCLLTALTQIGGVVFLITFLTFGIVNSRLNNWWTRTAAKVLLFVTLYSLAVFVVVPLAAKPFGRVPLPLLEEKNLKPANIWTCLLNRHYVRPQLKQIVLETAEVMNNEFPGASINYLDANFPFIDNFPLLPHLSHNDGKKLDVSFQYNDSVTGLATNEIPSLIGYGICEEPMEGEENKPEDCRNKGYWQYNLLRELVSQDNKQRFIFDNQRTRELVNAFASHDALAKIFIEPHLKNRLQLTSAKIRFHGCQAVRHDDHIHVQLK